jgi:hypothetical protein
VLCDGFQAVLENSQVDAEIASEETVPQHGQFEERS